MFRLFKRGRMNSKDEEKIQANIQYLESNLESRDIISALYSYKTIDKDDYDKINDGSTRVERTRRLIDILLLRGPSAYIDLIKALTNTGYHESVVKLEQHPAIDDGSLQVTSSIVGNGEHAGIDTDMALFMQRTKTDCVAFNADIQELKEDRDEARLKVHALELRINKLEKENLRYMSSMKAKQEKQNTRISQGRKIDHLSKRMDNMKKTTRTNQNTISAKGKHI